MYSIHLARPAHVNSSRTERIICAASAGKFVAGVRLLGVGSSVPKGIITNKDLETLVDTNDEWITSRTGIKQRHVLGPDESLTLHAIEASRRALDMAGVRPEQVDMIILATSSPDDLFGSAGQIQAALGCRQAVAFDLTAACSGFVLGLITASQFIRTGVRRNVLVVGADQLSRFVDWRDRGTCILFGDGSGAVLLSAEPGADCSLLGYAMHSDGTGQRSLCAKASYTAPEYGSKPLSAACSDNASFSNITMNGQEVFKFAVRSVPAVIQEGLDNAGLDKSAVDWFVLHQANQRILDGVAERFGVSPDRVVSNLAEYGNTSAATIPIVLDEAVRAQKIKRGTRWHLLDSAPD